MSIANPPPLGLEYNAVVEVVDKISAHTGLRTVDDFERLLCAMGGQIERVESQKWSAADSISLRVAGPKNFTAYLPATPSGLDRMLLACALGHYVLHSGEGRTASKIYRFCKDQTSLEGLWFGMSVVIPDAAFEVALAADHLDDAVVAGLFNVPPQLVGLKRKIVSSAKNRLDKTRAVSDGLLI